MSKNGTMTARDAVAAYQAGVPVTRIMKRFSNLYHHLRERKIPLRDTLVGDAAPVRSVRPTTKAKTSSLKTLVVRTTVTKRHELSVTPNEVQQLIGQAHSIEIPASATTRVENYGTLPFTWEETTLDKSR